MEQVARQVIKKKGYLIPDSNLQVIKFVDLLIDLTTSNTWFFKASTGQVTTSTKLSIKVISYHKNNEIKKSKCVFQEVEEPFFTRQI